MPTECAGVGDVSPGESSGSSGQKSGEGNPERAPTAVQDDLGRWFESLSTAAHDLKTPLSIVGGYIGLLLEEKIGPLNAGQREILCDMKQNEARLQRFIKDFVAFSAMQTAPLKPDFRTNDLRDCIADIAEVWRGRFLEKRVRLRIIAGPALAPFSFDYYKIQHVLSNLLDNALKFSAAGATVDIRAGRYKWERRSHHLPGVLERRSSGQLTVNSVRVSVSDAGPGIAPEYHEDIFRDFFRIESNGQTHGTGLGLAIARRLVLLHRGRIWVESEPGRGSTFSFVLPLKVDV